MSTLPMPKGAAPSATPPLQPRACDLGSANTLGLPCRAERCVDIGHASQLGALSDLADTLGLPLVLGGGSNVVLPETLATLVARVRLAGVRLVAERPDAWVVEAAAGESWHGLVAQCVAQGWDGLENLALIPGTVGAAPVQNIGAYGVELADRFEGLAAWHVPGRRLHRLGREECGFAYRDSIFKHARPGEWLIVSVRLALPRPWQPVLDYPDLRRNDALAQGRPTARAIFEAVCAIRRAKLPDPAEIGNAGSFFKNPLVPAEVRDALLARHPGLVSYPQPDGRYKLAAGWLIDQCGWKGRARGPAGVHDRQALVLVNRGGARAADILALARAVQADVQARYGVLLEPEPVVVPAGG